MRFIVLIENVFGLRDAWYVNGCDLADAMSEAGERMRATGARPGAVTVLPVKDNRSLRFLFPNDPGTDTELVHDFLQGHIRAVRLSYRLICEMEKEGSTEE